MDSNGKELVKRSERAFSKKSSFDSLCQSIAEQFYPERAQFTASHDWGEEFASHLFDASPVLMRRDLGNAFSSMLRPRGQPWFRLAAPEDVDEDEEVNNWLDSRTAAMRRMIYDRRSCFVRATKEADHDFATFGNAVLSVEERPTRDGIVLRCHHFKDCAWLEGMDGEPDTLFRNVQMSARQMAQFFNQPGDTLPAEVRRCLDPGKNADAEFTVRHVMMPAGDYDYARSKPAKHPWVSLYVCIKSKTLIREAPSWEFRYVVPRWQTISGSPYAVSPAAMTALPDARTMQAMARVMLESAEKAVDPPMKATEEAVRGEVNLHGGGITWVDKDYDERLGPALEPLALQGPVALGVDMMLRVAGSMREAWYLTKLSLPQAGERTAFETAQLVEEFIRQSIPLFEPMETEYNARVLDMIASIMLRVGAFGPMDEIPAALGGRDLEFSFANPLQDAIQKAKVSQFQAATQISAAARELDPDAAADFDVREAHRAAIRGSGAPSDWLVGREQADEAVEQMRQSRQAQQVAGEAAAAGGAAEQVGRGLQAISGGMA